MTRSNFVFTVFDEPAFPGFTPRGIAEDGRLFTRGSKPKIMVGGGGLEPESAYEREWE